MGERFTKEAEEIDEELLSDAIRREEKKRSLSIRQVLIRGKL